MYIYIYIHKYVYVYVLCARTHTHTFKSPCISNFICLPFDAQGSNLQRSFTAPDGQIYYKHVSEADPVTGQEETTTVISAEEILRDFRA